MKQILRAMAFHSIPPETIIIGIDLGLTHTGMCFHIMFSVLSIHDMLCFNDWVQAFNGTRNAVYVNFEH